MKNIYKYSFMVMMFAAFLFFVSCSKEKKTEKSEKPSKKKETEVVEPTKAAAAEEVKIGVILLNETDDYFSALMKSIQNESEKFGSEVMFCFNGNDPDTHVECANKLINDQGVQVLIADSPTNESFEKMVEIAKTKGVYVINTGIQKTIQRQPFVVQFIGKDNTEGGYKIGSTTGRLISEHFNGKGNVIIIDMPAENRKYTDRASSFRNGLNQYAYDAKVLTTAEGSESIDESQQIFENLLKQYPEANVAYSVCKESTIGAMKASKANGKDPKNFIITGYDATEEIFKSIRTGGFVRAVVVDQPDEIARVMILAATDLATGKRDLKEYQLQSHWILTALVTNENVDQYMD